MVSCTVKGRIIRCYNSKYGKSKYDPKSGHSFLQKQRGKHDPLCPDGLKDVSRKEHLLVEL